MARPLRRRPGPRGNGPAPIPSAGTGQALALRQVGLAVQLDVAGARVERVRVRSEQALGVRLGGAHGLQHLGLGPGAGVVAQVRTMRDRHAQVREGEALDHRELFGFDLAPAEFFHELQDVAAAGDAVAAGAQRARGARDRGHEEEFGGIDRYARSPQLARDRARRGAGQHAHLGRSAGRNQRTLQLVPGRTGQDRQAEHGEQQEPAQGDELAQGGVAALRCDPGRAGRHCRPNHAPAVGRGVSLSHEVGGGCGKKVPPQHGAHPLPSPASGRREPLLCGRTR